VKVKLKLDAICSPAMLFDHAGDHLASVEKFRLLTDNLATVVQNRMMAPSENTL
jgi:hypothetical protein